MLEDPYEYEDRDGLGTARGIVLALATLGGLLIGIGLSIMVFAWVF